MNYVKMFEQWERNNTHVRINEEEGSSVGSKIPDGISKIATNVNDILPKLIEDAKSYGAKKAKEEFSNTKFDSKGNTIKGPKEVVNFYEWAKNKVKSGILGNFGEGVASISTTQLGANADFMMSGVAKATYDFEYAKLFNDLTKSNPPKDDHIKWWDKYCNEIIDKYKSDPRQIISDAFSGSTKELSLAALSKAEKENITFAPKETKVSP